MISEDTAYEREGKGSTVWISFGDLITIVKESRSWTLPATSCKYNNCEIYFYKYTGNFITVNEY